MYCNFQAFSSRFISVGFDHIFKTGVDGRFQLISNCDELLKTFTLTLFKSKNTDALMVILNNPPFNTKSQIVKVGTYS